MTDRDRFRRVLHFQEVDRLPLMEWAPWWDKTLLRWRNEGLPQVLTEAAQIRECFGLDAHRYTWIRPYCSSFPSASHSASPVNSAEDYEQIKQHLYPESPFNKEDIQALAEEQRNKGAMVWFSVHGFFWHPRGLFGIEPHLYAFYDHPDLMKQMNEDLLEFNIRVIEQFCEICTPDIICFAEDMSYNHGPMLSKNQFEEFMAPYYNRIVPMIKERGIIAFVDTDGDITQPMGWFDEVGIQGFLPLERMAGVDIVELRKSYPEMRMIGAFDKTIMHLGEDRMRQEFERIFPVMRQGGFIPSVDHQTPPEVSLNDYKLYLKLLQEYCIKAAS